MEHGNGHGDRHRHRHGHGHGLNRYWAVILSLFDLSISYCSMSAEDGESTTAWHGTGMGWDGMGQGDDDSEDRSD